MSHRFATPASAPPSGSEPAAKSSFMWEGAAADAPPLHVITLLSSTAPVPLQAPTAPELAGLAVFRSRRIEDGRERFRLHIGYFPSVAAAERVLPIVRRSYPAAIVSVAPEGNLGSLDDTAVARFSIIRPIEAPAAADAEPAPAPVAAAARTSAAPSPSPLPARRRVDPPVLSVASIVPPPMPKTPLAAPEPAPQTKVKDAQRYAVQLVLSKEPIDLARLPTLAIFGGYLLYAVETEPGGRRMYGVRLGFYADALSARLVAQYVRSEFKGVAIVPVSDREVARATAATIHLPSNAAARGVSRMRVRWPQEAVSIDHVPSAQISLSASL